jgi:DNA-directed RNA polymerase specialized sigma24 family protein
MCGNARVFTRFESLRDEAALKLWIAQLPRRAAIDRIRADVRETPALDAELLSGEERGVEAIESGDHRLPRAR